MTEAGLHKLTYPQLCSFKLDGIRGTTTGSLKVKSRSGKSLPNKYIRQHLSHLPAGLDGELIIGSPSAEGCYNRTQSGVMSIEGTPDFTFYVFDVVPQCFYPMNMFTGFADRQKFLDEFLLLRNDKRLIHLTHTQCNTPDEVMEFMDLAVQAGYEGICGRTANGMYKFGRSTKSEAGLWRMKQEKDSECEILAIHPLYINNNDTQFTPLGYKERSSHQENLIAIDSVGSMTVRDIHTKVIFEVGIFKGVTSDERDKWWKKKDVLLGLVFKYRYHCYGIKDRPRSARFIGWRTAIDMD